MSEPSDDPTTAPSPTEASESPFEASRGVSPPAGSGARGGRPPFVFFGTVAAVALLLDIATKAWAEITLTQKPVIEVIPGHLSFVLAYNKGGAWGLLQDQSEVVRLPFFLVVSVLAILFIVSLFGKLAPEQRALKWGLPLVLGGALGNLSDRITRSSVIDFIDYRADWVLAMNRAIAKVARGWNTTDHWPTFNVADIAICIGVGFMAIDMFTSKRAQSETAPVAGGETANETPPPAG